MIGRRACSQNRRLLSFGKVERMEECSWPGKCRKSDGGGNLVEVRFTETWIEVIKKEHQRETS